MRAVWSFWSKPYHAGWHHRWPSEFHYALAWSLSVQEASKHYPDTWLYTDNEGARLLVDDLGLPFAHLSTELNVLADHDCRGWNVGKLFTYRMQKEPFLHLDYDVFLWQPLPIRLVEADVFFEKPIALSHSYVDYVDRLEDAVADVGGWLPEEWKWFRSSGRTLRHEACGLLGGSRVDFIHSVYELAFTIMEHRTNQKAWSLIAERMGLTTLLEEFLPAACLEYCRAHSTSPFHDVTNAYLFSWKENLFGPEQAVRAGYTHLIGGTKRNPAVAKLLEERMRRDDPVQFERCRKFAHQAVLR